jgi:hypothetical protein
MHAAGVPPALNSSAVSAAVQRQIEAGKHGWLAPHCCPRVCILQYRNVPQVSLYLRFTHCVSVTVDMLRGAGQHASTSLRSHLPVTPPQKRCVSSSMILKCTIPLHLHRHFFVNYNLSPSSIRTRTAWAIFWQME